MTGEIKCFRKRFIGGFNRQDVIDYIAVLAKESDTNRALKEKAEQDMKGLVTEIASLKRERDEAKRLAGEYKSEVLEAAKKTLEEFEVSFNSLSEGFEKESASICEQLEAARNIIAILPSALKRTGERFGKLRAILEEGQDTV
ncbi:MAG: hypothetical protein FWH57_01690 [Oscillospiraceae bacterium]|nr:hypothetical protein [Oscillospiraceae bacterium]